MAALAEDFLRAYTRWGFAYVTNHGIDPGLTDQVFSASRTFHGQALERKLEVALDANHRGYIARDTSTDVTTTLAEVTRPNQSESFMIMREDGPDSAELHRGDYLAGPNQWPDLPGFRETLTRYNSAMGDLSEKLVALVSMALGVENQLQQFFQPPTTWLRLLHYPTMADHAPDDLYGSAPHRDFGFITLLAQDNTGGLQVATPNGDWIDVPGDSERLVLNTGDMLHRWSNGIVRSTPHRVINRSGKERYSCAFFYDPHVNSIIQPLPECVDGDNPSRFEPLIFGDFLKFELQSSYDRHKIVSR